MTFHRIIFTICVIMFVACGKKTVPSKPVPDNTVINKEKTPPAVVKPTTTSIDSVTNKPVTTTTVSRGKPMIVVDSRGDMITTNQKLQENGATINFDIKNARGFTPEQRANLIARFKVVPPRILYVPESYAKTGTKGQYFILTKKFWYWKKADGFFYLDDNYYK
jgi:hypothetical protein